MTTNLYQLNPVPVKQMDVVTALFELRNSQRPDTVICHMLLPNNDVNFWNKLLRAQAAKAWEEGAKAQEVYESCYRLAVPYGDPMPPTPTNPYTAEAQVYGL